MQQREGVPVPQGQPARLVGPHGEGDPLRRHNEQQPGRQPWSVPASSSSSISHASITHTYNRALLHACASTDFYNWNRVKIRYCDGASFAGEGFDKAQRMHLRPIYYTTTYLERIKLISDAADN